MNKTFQRVGAVSNAHVGRDFEIVARDYFASHGVVLTANFRVPVGHERKKDRQFDLGSNDPKVIVECKSHRWTIGGNIPSAKITVWNESMYYFHLAPSNFRKVMFVLYDYDPRRNLTLAEYYVRNYGHLIPEGVELLEYNESSGDTCTVIAT